MSRKRSTHSRASGPHQPPHAAASIPADSTLRAVVTAEEPDDSLSRAARRSLDIRSAAYRETIESIAVAIILALLFRAFVAEAFVIPTGSMAPSLMGAHKDQFCPECGIRYPVGASVEDKLGAVVVGTICSNCRYVNALDLVANDTDTTFTGDRILVSKFAYALSNPARWDVSVFKFPGNPKQNYIKRLVGLPNETLMIHHGDVYGRPSSGDSLKRTDWDVANREFEILRKPPDKLLAMAHHVHDTRYQSDTLVKANFPSSWQPWAEGLTAPPTDSWQVSVDEAGVWTATLAPSGDDWHTLRYFHRVPTSAQWDRARRGLSLADVDPYGSHPITDFYSYNTYLYVPGGMVYDVTPAEAKARASGLGRLIAGIWPPPGRFSPSFKNADLGQFDNELRFGNYGTAEDGLHWVGDLILEAELETGADATDLRLEIVEAGVRYVCTIDLKTGLATLEMVDTEPRYFAAAGVAKSQTVSGSTALRAGRRASLRFSNADDELLLWVNDKLVSFDGPTTFDHRDFRSEADNRPRFDPERHPLDAAPLAISVRGGPATIQRLGVQRDKYYIATKQSFDGLNDYDLGEFARISGARSSPAQIQQALGDRDQWDDFAGWQARRTVAFELGPDQFFPMGDNSPESQDARCWVDARGRFGMPRSPDPYAFHWASNNYVPRDLLVGKALMVFWPHPWNQPFPITPNLRRIALIR